VISLTENVRVVGGGNGVQGVQGVHAEAAFFHLYLDGYDILIAGGCLSERFKKIS